MATAQSGSEIVSGKVRDELGLVMVNVIELDEANRSIARRNGYQRNFSIRIKAPETSSGFLRVTKR